MDAKYLDSEKFMVHVKKKLKLVVTKTFVSKYSADLFQTINLLPIKNTCHVVVFKIGFPAHVHL